MQSHPSVISVLITIVVYCSNIDVSIQNAGVFLTLRRVQNLLQLSRELTKTVFWRSISSREDRSSTWRSNSPVNRHRRWPGWKQTRWVVVHVYRGHCASRCANTFRWKAPPNGRLMYCSLALLKFPLTIFNNLIYDLSNVISLLLYVLQDASRAAHFVVRSDQVRSGRVGSDRVGSGHASSSANDAATTNS